MIETYKVEVTTTGGDASATGSGYTDRPIRGKLIDIYLDYAGTAPATTDVVITDEEIGHTLCLISGTLVASRETRLFTSTNGCR